MYLINDDYKVNNSILDLTDIISAEGFVMGQKRALKIDGVNIRCVKILNKSLAHDVVVPKVMEKYNQLIKYLTDVIVDDDSDDDGTYREALNQIEKFRLIIKNKYRRFLTKKDLELMSKQLVILQKELNNKLLEIHNSYMEDLENTRSR